MRYRSPFSWKKRPPDPAVISAGIAHIESMKPAPVTRDAGASGIVPEVIGKFWRFVGPIDIYDPANNSGQTPTSGRINAVAFDPAKKDTWYAGSSNGGVWKTTDSGKNWKPITDDWPLLYVSSIAVDKSGKDIYVGTGDCPIQGSYAMGVMKSDDSGGSWKNVSADGFKTSLIAAVAVHPDSSDIVLAADFYGSLWRSKDAGKRWHTVNSSQKGWVSIAWSARNHEGHRVCYAMARDGKHVYVSDNEADNWKVHKSPVGSKVSDGRPQIAASPISPKTVYLYSPDLQKIWSNTNAGEGDWTNITSHYKDNGEASYCYCMACSYDAKSKVDILYVGQYSVYRCAVGFGIWELYEGDDPGHADMHALAVCPSDPDLVLIGNDGGVYELKVIGFTREVRAKNKTLAVPQVYQAGCSPFGVVLAGMQDTGTAIPKKIDEWRYLQPELGGDGGGCAVNSYFTEFATSNFFVPSQIQMCYSVDGWKTSRTIVNSKHPMAKDPNPAANPPMVIDPYDPLRLYVATTYLYQWTQKKPAVYGGSWKNRLGDQRLSGQNTVMGIAIGSTNGDSGNRIYTGGFNGEVWMSNTSGNNWRKINGNLPSKIRIGAVSVNPQNADDVVVVLLSGNSSSPSLAWRCKDTTKSSPKWVDVGGPAGSSDALPGFPLRAMARDLLDPVNTWYVGGDGGLFYTNDGGAHWYNAGHPLGLPNAPIYQLQVTEASGMLVATTFGRGIYTAQLVSPVKVKSLKLSPSPVVGGKKVSGTVTMDGDAPPLGVHVYLTSSNTSAAKVPASVKIDAKKKSGQFSITTKAVKATDKCTITAAYGGTSKTAKLTVESK